MENEKKHCLALCHLFLFRTGNVVPPAGSRRMRRNSACAEIIMRTRETFISVRKHTHVSQPSITEQIQFEFYQTYTTIINIQYSAAAVCVWHWITQVGLIEVKHSITPSDLHMSMCVFIGEVWCQPAVRLERSHSNWPSIQHSTNTHTQSRFTALITPANGINTS